MRKKWNGTDRIFALAVLSLAASLVCFALLLCRNVKSASVVCQSIVSLDGLSYNEDFLKTAEEIPGILSITPVQKVSVRLKAGDYSMETEFIGVDLSELRMTGTKKEDIRGGNTPVLLIGEKSLFAMTDQNGHKITKKKQKELLENYEKITWQYQLIENAESDWLPCTAAAVLSSPAEDIYISFAQAAELKGTTAAVWTNGENITEILLTVQGIKNYTEAAALLPQS